VAGATQSNTCGCIVAGTPAEVTSATAVPRFICAPAAGFWPITLPAGSLSLYWVVTVPSVRPAVVSAVVAADCVIPTTLGITPAASPLALLLPLRLTAWRATEGARFRVLSLKYAAPESRPVVCGVKLKLSEQDAPGFSENTLPHVELGFCAKFVPRVRARVPVSGWLPTF
jgi:hypothetical protein